MECNKDEAIRVTGIAELKFAKKDLVGAKKFTLKALRLYPDLDDAIQLSAVLDVHIAAQVKVGISEPEPDYYGILQVEPLSDDSTIKQQCRNLSKLVHPDKNKESMKEKSEAAFKLIAKAFEVLSDEETRFQHDSKRGEKPTAKEPPKPTYSTRQPQQQDVKRGGTPNANPLPQSESRKQEPPKATYFANQPRYEAAAQSSPGLGAQASQAPNTFWTQASPTPGAQASQAPNTFWTPTSPAPGAQASQAPNTFWTQASPTPGAQASQAPNTFWTPTSPAPGAQASQAPNTFWTQASPTPGAQASQAPNTFWTPTSPAPGAQASQAPNTFWTQASPTPGAQASQAPNTFWTPTSPAPGAQASQAPNTFWTPMSPAPGAQAFQAPYIFWTACPLCRMQHQCMSIFLNHQVVCHKCHSSFHANDINVYPANGASAFVWSSGPLGNNNPFLPTNGASAFVWPPELWGNNNPILAGMNWYEMYQNYLAPAYGASTNGTSWNDLLSNFSSANPFGDYGNNLSPTQFCLNMLLSAMNLS